MRAGRPKTMLLSKFVGRRFTMNTGRDLGDMNFIVAIGVSFYEGLEWAKEAV